MQQQRHAGFSHHLKKQRFVHFGVERRNRRNVIRRIGKMATRSALAHQPLDHLLRDAADDAFLRRMKGHPWTNHCGGRSTAQKTVTLEQKRTGTVTRRRNRRRATRIAAAHDQHVELS